MISRAEERSSQEGTLRRLLGKLDATSMTMEERAAATIDLTKRLLRSADEQETRSDKRIQRQVVRMIEDPIGKPFTTSLTDQCFRSRNPQRVADQMHYLLNHYGIPGFIPLGHRVQLRIFHWLSQLLPNLLVPLAKKMLRLETSRYIWPADSQGLRRRINGRLRQGVRVNINHLGEAILGEEEALNRLQIYLDSLEKPEIEYISVKISTICSQLNLLAYEATIDRLAERLRKLYRTAASNHFICSDGRSVPKFVNLDMEEYADLHLTVDVFKKVLSEPEFKQHSAGIVLQAYIPESYQILQMLTQWAQKRVEEGGVAIKVRLVKGANLSMERVTSAQHDWPQAPYTSKVQVDANFRRCVLFALQKKHLQAVRIGLGSHNLFDVSFALLLQTERGLSEGLEFEMLEGMAEPMRRAVQEVAGHILLYCPTANEREFQNAIAYLIRRLDENTAPDNFLRHVFSLKVDTPEWNEQVDIFLQSLRLIDSVSAEPRRRQDRCLPLEASRLDGIFENEPDTDWTSLSNRRWIADIAQQWMESECEVIPLVIGGNEVGKGRETRTIEDPSCPGRKRAVHVLATEEDIQHALECAEHTYSEWSQVDPEERIELLWRIAQTLRQRRAEFIGVMMTSCGKIAEEADVEYSEAIDFVEYYRYHLRGLHKLSDVHWQSRGTVVVAPPWNFPASIPLGGIVAALVTGNVVLFKPAPEAVQVGWHIAQACWDSGVSKKVLQFISCEDEPVGSKLIKDPRVNTVILTGASSTARKLMKLRPDLTLFAETGGKNSLIVTAMADRDLAVGDIVRSAFGHAGQKCSACSLLILQEEVYNDVHFLNQLRDAAASLPLGPSWDLKTKMGPLIRPPEEILLRGLTCLEEGEEWLLQPKQDETNPQLWSPGIKLGVRQGGFTHRNELFGPVLGVMCAKNLDQALEFANDTPYGLTAGIHSLDTREQQIWTARMQAGNLYINNGITGAVVNRQPFGGHKDSAFGSGYKAGGPNYLFNFMTPTQVDMPAHEAVPDGRVQQLSQWVLEQLSDEKQKKEWIHSIGSYAYWWKHHFSRKRDPNRLIGQDNLLYYIPKTLSLRILREDKVLDVYRSCAAALTCGAKLEVSGDSHWLAELFNDYSHLEKENLVFVAEDEQKWLKRLSAQSIANVRLLQVPLPHIQEQLALMAARVSNQLLIANGRIELLHYVREVSLCVNYHRYGNLGDREHEIRASLPSADD